MTDALSLSTEDAKRPFERLVDHEELNVIGREVLRGAQVVADRELRLVRVSRGVRGLEIEMRGALRGVSAHEMAGDDRGRDATCERRVRQVLTERTVHARAGH